ncbi:MAG: hypothetical protein JKY48_03215 [Flavobacteriales bacterium]|nr:hypothetical protein [Flavobacteriales bacterium]
MPLRRNKHTDVIYMRRILTLLLVFPLFSYGQEGVGVLTDNYMPVNQSKLNPSAMVDQKPWLSINLLGAHGYLRNNFAYLQNTRLNLLDKDPTAVFDPPSTLGKVFVTGEVLGPSATLNIKNQAFGIHTSVRTYANMNRIPAVLGEIIADESIENIEDGLYEINNGRLKTMSWAEVGLSYGRNLYKRNEIMIDGGISIKRLIGIHQASLTVKNGLAEVINGDGVIRNLDAKYSYTEPAYGAGGGWGITLGGTYKKMNDYTDSYIPHSSSSGCKWLGYKYKIGASLIDLGYIRFKQGARTAALTDTVRVDDVENIDEDVLGKDKNKYTGALPTALSIQADYHLKDNFYANAIIVQRLSLRNSFGVERSNLLTISPRYESSLFSVSLPLSLANYEVPQVGLYFRVGPLALGTDHLSPFFIKHDIKAASFFIYLNLALKSPACRDKAEPKFGKWFCPVW